MPREAGIRLREIVGRRMLFENEERITKYTLPFIDATWKVPFIVLDLLGGPPKILSGKIHSDAGRLRTSVRTSDLRAIESIPAEHFASLVHWDPWWAFRGVGGVDRAWIEAIIATNIARAFQHEGRTFKVHDLRFADGMEELEALIAKDEVYRVTEFRPRDIDLLALRPRPRAIPREFREAESAKAL